MVFVLVLCKILPLLPEFSRATFAKNKKLYPHNAFWGPRPALVTSPPYTKTNFRRQAIPEPIFSVANTDFEGGYDGRGCGVRHFFGQIGPTQPWQCN
jgi:hypothetical protein